MVVMMMMRRMEVVMGVAVVMVIVLMVAKVMAKVMAMIMMVVVMAMDTMVLMMVKGDVPTGGVDGGKRLRCW